VTHPGECRHRRRCTPPTPRLEIIGIREGYDGLLYPDRYADGGATALAPQPWDASPISAGQCSARPTVETTGCRDAAGRRHGEVDRAPGPRRDPRARHRRAHRRRRRRSLAIARNLFEMGLRRSAFEAIDNDLDATAMTFGYHSAVSFATECIDQLHVTAQAHRHDRRR
jgi:6-phosphofructokinase 1